VVLHHLANALLEVGGREDAEVGIAGQPLTRLRAVGELHDDREDAVRVGLERVGQRDLRSTGGGIAGHDLANRGVAPCITADRFENRRDVLEDGADAQRLGHHLAEIGGLRRGIGFGHQQCRHAIGAERADAQCRTDTAVDAPRQTQHGAAASHGAEDRAADDVGNPIDFAGGIQPKRDI
jgi:hypothetical protein